MTFNFRQSSLHASVAVVFSIGILFGAVRLVCGQVEIGPRAKPGKKVAPRTGRIQKAPTNVVNLGGGVRIEMVLIEAGTFTMGSLDGESDEQPIHRVTISRPFYLGMYEVTQEQWAAVMGTRPSMFKGGNLPVEQVSWEKVQEFLRALNAKTGGRWRLPTEAEWEYACRAGTTGDYAGNLDDLGWYDSNSDTTTHPVGQKRSNRWGLYDMHGNVLEWCQDWFGSYTRDEQTDPAGATVGSRRVFRGGCWYYRAARCRSAFRFGWAPDQRGTYVGFRLARTL